MVKVEEGEWRRENGGEVREVGSGGTRTGKGATRGRTDHLPEA